MNAYTHLAAALTLLASVIAKYARIIKESGYKAE
jgi:hypothetical protein